jgi:hypothetical protein
MQLQQEAKEEEDRGLLYEKISSLEEKLDRKEYFLQAKEKKWLQVEKILEEFVIEDDDLKERLADLRIHVLPRTKLTNVIQKNETLRGDLNKAYREIDRLRKVMIDPFSMHRGDKSNKRRAQKPREFTVDLEDNMIVINYKDNGKD